MLMNNPIGESIGAVRWCLAGSVSTPAPLTRMGRSVKLIRCFDGLSPRDPTRYECKVDPSGSGDSLPRMLS